jgi:hypothetical protein
MEAFSHWGASMKSSLRLSLGLSALLLGVQVSGAAFAGGFYASPARQDASSGDVGVDAQGNAIFSWTHFTPQGVVAQSRRRAANGAFAGTQTLSKTGGDAKSAHIAVNGAGAAVFVWLRNAGAQTPVQGRVRAADGSLSSIFTVESNPGGQFSFDSANPNVAIDDAGNAVFTWIGLDGDQKRRAYARRRSAGGAFGPVMTLSPAVVSEVKMAVNGAGDAVFVWIWNDGVGHNLVQARQLPAGGKQGPIMIIAQGIAPSGGGGRGTVNPRAGMDPDGNALIVWEQPDGEGPCGINGCPKVLARVLKSNGKVVAQPQTLTTTINGGFSPQVAVDSLGRAVVAWLHDGIEFRTRAKNGTLGKVQKFTTAADATEPVLKGDPAGNTVAVWHSGTVVKARARSKAGVLGSPKSFSIGGQSAGGGVLAVGANGDAVVGWVQSDGLGQCSGGSSCSRIGGGVVP